MSLKEWIRHRYFEVKLYYCKFFGRKYKFDVCGHMAKLMELVKIFGREYVSVLGIKELDYCHQCLAKMAIRCAWCQSPIKVGDPVVLYPPEFQIRGASIYRKGPLIVCLNHNCTGVGVELGLWVVPGKMLRTFSPTKECIAHNGRAGRQL